MAEQAGNNVHDAPPRVAVCIPTYRRNAGLEKLILALQGLTFETGRADFGILVIDNNPDHSAAPVVERLAASSRWPIEYRHEVRPGVSAVRNSALDATREADFIAFLDDDEWPDPQWLDQLLAVWRRTGADVVTGVVLPVFETEPQDWVISSGVFERERHRDGEPITYARTGNVLVRRRLFDELGLRFDEELSLIGGEDTILFERIRRAGGTIVWADYAVVHEVVPADRMRLGWLAKRWYRTGGTEAQLLRLRHDSPATSAINVMRGVVRIGGGMLLLAVSLAQAAVSGSHRVLKPLRTILRGCGLVVSVLDLQIRQYGGEIGTGPVPQRKTN